MQIRKLREDKGMMLIELAHECGIKKSALSLYETGKRSVPSALLPKIAKALGCTTDDLFGEEVQHADTDEKEIRAETE